jgi:hypothetical protein
VHLRVNARQSTAPGKKIRIDWVVVAALMPDRTSRQCSRRRRAALGPHIDRTPGRVGKWTMDGDSKLKGVVETHAIVGLVPDRTKRQCWGRWHDSLGSCIDWKMVGASHWTSNKYINLFDAVRTYSGKDRYAIATFVPGWTRLQCCRRWRNALGPALSGRLDILAYGSCE